MSTLVKSMVDPETLGPNSARHHAMTWGIGLVVGLFIALWSTAGVAGALWPIAYPWVMILLTAICTVVGLLGGILVYTNAKSSLSLRDGIPHDTVDRHIKRATVINDIEFYKMMFFGGLALFILSLWIWVDHYNDTGNVTYGSLMGPSNVTDVPGQLVPTIRAMNRKITSSVLYGLGVVYGWGLVCALFITSGGATIPLALLHLVGHDGGFVGFASRPVAATASSASAQYGARATHSNPTARLVQESKYGQ